MSDQTQSKQVMPEPAPMGCMGLIMRMLWLIVGNMALYIIAAVIFMRHTFSYIDIVFWVVIAGLILIRYIDITRMNGLTSNNKPATLKHWRMYVIKLLAASAALWGLAHGIPYLTSR